MSILRIELLEDCEMNSGRVVNTYFVDDVFFDGYGFPYLPAWVIRNSLVKAIEESPGLIEDDAVEALVGMYANLVIDDAIIADRESMRQAILSNENGGLLLRSPVIVLNASGLTKVKKTSVTNKFVRMLSKGDIFEAHYELSEEYREAFRTLISRINGIFVGHKSRALFTIDEEWGDPHYAYPAPKLDFDGERCRLEYDLQLISHMTSLNHVSGELEANSFITGAEIRTALESRGDLADLFAARDSNITCSYAYIDACGRRGLPIPASYSTKKQDKSDLRDRCSLGRRQDDFDQIKGVGALYIDDPDGLEVRAMSVRKEQAIAQYYRDGAWRDCPYCAIGRGQTFKGFIEGPAESIRCLCDALMQSGRIRVGNLSNLGFGFAFLQVHSVTTCVVREPMFVDEATILLASPARLYRGAVYQPSAQNVLQEVQALLGGTVELEIVRNSQKTCQIATYNKAWHEMEPLEYAMQAGSIYRVKAKDGQPFDIAPAMGGAFIGGHNDIGYGETWILPAVDAYYRKISYHSLPESDFPLTFKVDPNPGRRLLRLLYQKNANSIAAYIGSTTAEEFFRKEFIPGAFEEVRSKIGDDFDVAPVFEAYLEALREYGLNAIGRIRHD